ncbi:MAG: Zn-ribbon domain-containing OB-fold protein [Nitrosotalea sp.]
MNKFEQELKNNNFVCSRCTRCNKMVWPPSDLCNKCFDNVVWVPVSRNARLVEFSRKDEEYFGIAEFDGGIRVMGTIQSASILHVGQPLILTRCSYDGVEKFVFSTCKEK